jgi:hypothetical protein
MPVDRKDFKVQEQLKNIIAEVLTDMNQRFSEELFSKTESELECYWHFTWDDTKTAVFNTYQFFLMLDLYKSFCRRWEEHHNGSCCVVERVRDKYLIPKIKEYVDRIEVMNISFQEGENNDGLDRKEVKQNELWTSTRKPKERA